MTNGLRKKPEKQQFSIARNNIKHKENANQNGFVSLFYTCPNG